MRRQLMALAPLIAFSVLAYTAFGIFASQTGGRIDASISVVILNGIATALPLAYYVIVTTLTNHDPVPTTGKGVVYSIAAGVAVGAFSIAILIVFARGGVSYAFPLIYGSAIVLGALAGWTLLGESISPLHVAGVAVTAVGVGLVALATR